MGFASCKAFGRSIPASLPKPQAPSPREGAECGAAALTKQGRLKSVAHSRCTTQRHQRLTTRIGATPKARTLWLLAKSFARCKTNRASNAKHPFLSTIEAYRQSESSGKTTGAFSYPDSSTLSVAGTAFYLSDTVAVIIRNIRINAVARAEFSRNNTV